VPIISALCHPYDKASSEFFCASRIAIIDIPKPKISEAKCDASVKIAIEFATYPPYNSTRIKTKDTLDAM
jgi:hypothetical protein